MQSSLVALILAACVAYTVRRLWKRLAAPPTGDVRCADCPLADTCQHRREPEADCCHGGAEGTCCHGK